MLIRRLRGLIGMALTWGLVGAGAGAAMFLLRYRPWPPAAIHWGPAAAFFGRWEAVAGVWGMACGLGFGLALMVGERSRRFGQLSASRLTLWGALAGAMFPALLSVRPILGGASVTYFGMIVGASAITGALWARGAVAIARRTDEIDNGKPVPALASPEPHFTPRPRTGAYTKK